MHYGAGIHKKYEWYLSHTLEAIKVVCLITPGWETRDVSRNWTTHLGNTHFHFLLFTTQVYSALLPFFFCNILEGAKSEWSLDSKPPHYPFAYFLLPVYMNFSRPSISEVLVSRNTDLLVVVRHRCCSSARLRVHTYFFVSHIVQFTYSELLCSSDQVMEFESNPVCVAFCTFIQERSIDIAIQVLFELSS